MNLHATFIGLVEARSGRVHGRRVAMWFTAACLLLLALCTPANADVGVVLNDSLDTSIAKITESGHSAVYLSRICAESPIKARLCRPGEAGSVISIYIHLGEDQSFGWNITPVNIYLYGVEDLRNKPLVGTHQVKRTLEERYRDTFLSPYCQLQACRTSNNAEWREMVGAALSRNIYIFVSDTSLEQDLDLIARLNSLPNENHFNGVTRNCADFTRDLINFYFPHATRANYFSDFGIASPKAIARSFTHYSLQHPETHFRVLHIAQLPGDLKQSSEARMGTEQITHSKEFLLPMLVVAPHELAIAGASYVFTGRFNPEHEFEKHPTAAATDIAFQIQSAKGDKDHPLTAKLQAEESDELAKFVASGQEWRQDRDRFNWIETEAIQEEIIPNREALKQLFARLDARGTPYVGDDGQLWMDITDQGGTFRVGLSADNVLAPGSDPQLAYSLLLARVRVVLDSSKYRREPLPELESDMALLQKARTSTARMDPAYPALLATGSPDGIPQRLFSWVMHLLS